PMTLPRVSGARRRPRMNGHRAKSPRGNAETRDTEDERCVRNGIRASSDPYDLDRWTESTAEETIEESTAKRSCPPASTVAERCVSVNRNYLHLDAAHFPRRGRHMRTYRDHDRDVASVSIEFAARPAEASWESAGLNILGKTISCHFARRLVA